MEPLPRQSRVASPAIKMETGKTVDFETQQLGFAVAVTRNPEKGQPEKTGLSRANRRIGGLSYGQLTNQRGNDWIGLSLAIKRELGPEPIQIIGVESMHPIFASSAPVVEREKPA